MGRQKEAGKRSQVKRGRQIIRVGIEYNYRAGKKGQVKRGR